MNSIIGMSELLVKQRLGLPQMKFAESIHKSAINLLDIINDVLDIARIESGQMFIDASPLDIREICEDVMVLFQPKTNDRKTELIFSCPLHIPTKFIGDAARIRQILINLVGNAVKFTVQGYINVAVSCEEIGNKEATLRIDVTDTGTGIPEDKISKLFKRFSQVETLSPLNSGGSGLGLAICKEMVQMMGGEIGVESRPGVGSIFWFTLRLPFDDSREEETEPYPLLQNKRILVVDDIHPNRIVLKDFCTALGGKCEEASSPETALMMFRSACEKNAPYHLVFIDQHMPRIDGVKLGQKIRSEYPLSGSVLILLSSNLVVSEEEGGGADGVFQAILNKPLQFQIFHDKVMQLYTPENYAERNLAVVSRQLEESVHSSETDSPLGLEVLVVEDNISNQLVAVAMLQYFGCHADVAANGREAVEMVNRKSYEIIFMDCLMPVMNGFEATAEIRSMKGQKGRSIIIALTANVLKGYRKKCLAAGMNDYLSKPLQSPELKKILDRWTNPLWHITGIIEPDAKAYALGASFEPVFSTDRLKELLLMFNKTGKDFYSTVVIPYLKNLDESVKGFDTAIKERRFVELYETAHRLKGGSTNLGLTKISMICAKLMEHAQRECIQSFVELIPSLERQALVVTQYEDKLKELNLSLYHVESRVTAEADRLPDGSVLP